MIVELGVMLTFLLPGMAILQALNVAGSLLAGLGFLVGTSLYVALAVCQASLGLPSLPVWTMAATWAVGLAVWAPARHRRALPLDLRQLSMLLVATAAVVAVLRASHLVTWHSDSFRYLLAGGMIARGSADIMPVDLITQRMAAFPMLLAPANLVGDHYFRSFAPLLGLATVWTLSWLLFQSLSPPAPGCASDTAVAPSSGASSTQHLHRNRWDTLAVVLMLVSINRFMWNSLYVNGHLLFAAYLLALVGCGWIRIRQLGLPPTACTVVQTAGAVGIALVRPEGPIVAALALFPFFCCTQLTKWERAIPWFMVGLSTLAWQGFAVRVAMSWGTPVASSTWGLIGLAVLLMATAGLCFWPLIERWLSYALPTAEIGLWLALAVLTFRQPEIFMDSLQATVDNLVLNATSWGSSLVLLLTLVLVLLGLTRMPDRSLLRFPVTTFFPFAFIAAYLRHGSYRVGEGDSLARMSVHIVPLTALLIGSHLLATWRYTSVPQVLKPKGGNLVDV